MMASKDLELTVWPSPPLAEFQAPLQPAQVGLLLHTNPTSLSSSAPTLDHHTGVPVCSGYGR